MSNNMYQKNDYDEDLESWFIRITRNIIIIGLMIYAIWKLF